MRLRVGIAADHGGFDLKQTLIQRLRESIQLVDMGAHEFDASDDYPDYVEPLARAVAAGEVDRGILICGSGVGACVAANKVRGVRAAVCHDTYSAHQGEAGEGARTRADDGGTRNKGQLHERIRGETSLGIAKAP